MDCLLSVGDHNLTVQSKELVNTSPDKAWYSNDGLLIEIELIGPSCSSYIDIFSILVLCRAFLYIAPFREPT